MLYFYLCCIISCLLAFTGPHWKEKEICHDQERSEWRKWRWVVWDIYKLVNHMFRKINVIHGYFWKCIWCHVYFWADCFSINSQGTFIDAIYSLISPCSFSDAPVYLSSQSYMADSSLSEEMSQFDFSTGVQSFSYNSQNPSGGSSRTRVLLRR